MPINKAGLLKTTLIDYPGKIACSIFLPGCNLRCPYCHNRELALGKQENLIPAEEILSHIKKRKSVLQGVCISGGEPLIHSDLPDFIKEIRSLGLKIKIDTNGLIPDRILDSKPDYIALDIKTSPGKYHLLTGESGCLDWKQAGKNMEISARLIIESGIKHEIRTTLVPGIITSDDMEIIASIASGCRKFTLNRFQPVNTLDPEYAKLRPFTEEEYLQLASVLERNGIKAVFRGN